MHRTSVCGSQVSRFANQEQGSGTKPLSEQETSSQDICGLPDQQAMLVAKVQETLVLCTSADI